MAPRTSPAAVATTGAPPVLLVFSHLRWGFVYRRPQHLLTRLAEHWRVVFIEEPLHGNGPARLELQQQRPGLTVLVPHTPVAAAGFHDDQLATLQALLSTWLQARGLQADVAWLYTPMALPLAQATGAAVLVYDCMNELAALEGAPRQLRQRESALLTVADLVLTGGPSLFEAKRDANHNVHCIPSAVDAAHFAAGNLRPGSAEDVAAQRLQGHLPRPRLGFYGVIDERLDIALVATLAEARPDWAIVMAGPVVKIDPATLPCQANLHWLGMQPYERLPYLLAGWDLCLMPYAQNASTRFLSPTKTLEYMASETPVVSTPLRDVTSLYGEVVAVAHGGHQGFIQACDALLAESGTPRYRRAHDMLNTVSMHAWDRSADSVHALMSAALARARASAPGDDHRTPALQRA
jgi:glycosyltransferase involved in cell wall biosynthesis